MTEDLDALRQDAARYRWLRELPPKTNIPGLHITFAVPLPPPNEWCIRSVNCEALDAAIDRAMTTK